MVEPLCRSGYDVAHRQKQAADPGAQCEPPGGKTVTVGELSRAYGGRPLTREPMMAPATSQGRVPAAVKIRGALYSFPE